MLWARSLPPKSSVPRPAPGSPRVPPSRQRGELPPPRPRDPALHTAASSGASRHGVHPPAPQPQPHCGTGPRRDPLPLTGSPAPCAVTSDAAVSRRWGGSVWGRMAAAAVTCGTPGGKSQGLWPAAPPPRQGAQLHRPRRGAARRPPPSSGRSCPLPSSSPAPGAAPPRAPPPTCARGLPRGPPDPHGPSGAARPRTLLRSFPRTSLPPCGLEAGPSQLRASLGTTAPRGGPPWARPAP